MHFMAITISTMRSLLAMTAPIVFPSLPSPTRHRCAWVSQLARALVLMCLCVFGVVATAADFLDPEQAFILTVAPKGPRSVELNFRIADGYYLYRERFQLVADGATLGQPSFPAGHVKFDETFQKQVETYRGELKVELPVEQAAAAFELRVTSQGCADAGLCYPPMTQAWRVSLAAWGGNQTASLAAPGAEPQTSAVPAATQPGRLLDGGPAASAAAPAASAPWPQPGGGSLRQASNWLDGQGIDGLLHGGSWWTALGAFWLMGLLLSFTPCVLPMLPILSSVIAGGGEVSRQRSFALALCYSLGMAVVYTALGVAAGLAGEGLAAALQKPWVLGLFAAMLAVFSLAMFDVYELRLPHALANHLDGAARRLPGGRFAGVFLMGGLSALIVSPCVTAPLAGALVFLSQTRNVVFGGAALFALAMGMSVPLLLLGASAGTWLPRSGSWMHAVKRFFGLLLLGVALWIVQPVLPAWAVLAAWGALLLVAGFMLRPFDPNPHSGAPRVWLQRAAGLAALSFGVMQLAGAASGGSDPLQPLRHLVGDARQAPTSALPFVRVRNVAELDAALSSAGRPVMLDFYADWCVSCKEMERFTFTDEAVRQRLQGALLLKADVTANTAEDKALLQRFALFGPPGTIFFSAQGAEMASLRVIGFRPARAFEKTLQDAGL